MRYAWHVCYMFQNFKNRCYATLYSVLHVSEFLVTFENRCHVSNILHSVLHAPEFQKSLLRNIIFCNVVNAYGMFGKANWKKPARINLALFTIRWAVSVKESRRENERKYWLLINMRRRRWPEIDNNTLPYCARIIAAQSAFIFYARNVAL